MKVLILGLGQSNFLNQLYGGITRKSNDFDFHLDGYYDLSNGTVLYENLPYTNISNFKSREISKVDFLKVFINFLGTRFFWQIILFELSQKRNFNSIKKLILSFIEAKYRTEKYINPLKADIIHFHFCTPEKLMEIQFLNPITKTICTFWGSDLLRMTGVSNVFYVKKALDRASAITVQTPELGEILYCKYGRKFQNKLHILKFTLDEQVFVNIDKYRIDTIAKTNFKVEFRIPLKKIVVAIGHNGFPENNHILILSQINKLPRAIIDDYVFIIHASYGADEKYLKYLKRKREEMEHLNIIIIDKFFGPPQMALQRLITDLIIQMPKSDALSAALTEVLYAGNIAVTGAWLPYGSLRRNNVNFKELESLEDLPDFIENFKNNHISMKTANINNSGYIRRSFFEDTTTPKWIELYYKTNSSE